MREKTIPAKSAREIEVKEKMEKRIEWRGQSESQIGGQRSGSLVGATETSKELAEWPRLQQRNLSILGLLRRKEWPQCHRESSWQVRRSRPCQKEKSHQLRAPDHEGGEPQVGEKEGDQNENMERKGWTSR